MFTGTIFVDNEKIRLEPRSHRLPLRQPLAPVRYTNKTGPTSGLFSLDSHQTSTLDRTTYRNNAKKYQINDKYHTNSLQCRHHKHKSGLSQLRGKETSDRRQKEEEDTSNGIIVDSQTFFVDITNQRLNNSFSAVGVFSPQTNGSRIEHERPRRPKSVEKLFDEVKKDSKGSRNWDFYHNGVGGRDKSLG